MSTNQLKIPKKNKGSYEKLEQVLGCKWSVSVLLTVQKEIKRPGAIEKNIKGISTKVLTERLRKLTEFGLLEKQMFPEIPPRTEYTLTEAGLAVVEIIIKIQDLDVQLEKLKKNSP